MPQWDLTKCIDFLTMVKRGKQEQKKKRRGTQRNKAENQQTQVQESSLGGSDQGVQEGCNAPSLTYALSSPQLQNADIWFHTDRVCSLKLCWFCLKRLHCSAQRKNSRLKVVFSWQGKKTGRNPGLASVLQAQVLKHLSSQPGPVAVRTNDMCPSVPQFPHLSSKEASSP